MPRFVLLYHDCPPGYERSSHWDFMLEAEGVLRTWALARLPRTWTSLRERTAQLATGCAPNAGTDSVDAQRLGDHRLAYLEYEGPLSAGRGQVRRIDGGTYTTRSESGEGWQVRLFGDVWSGPIRLLPTTADSRDWQLVVEELSEC